MFYFRFYNIPTYLMLVLHTTSKINVMNSSSNISKLLKYQKGTARKITKPVVFQSFNPRIKSHSISSLCPSHVKVGLADRDSNSKHKDSHMEMFLQLCK